MTSKEIAEYLHKYEGWGYRAALKEAEHRTKKAGTVYKCIGGGFIE